MKDWKGRGALGGGAQSCRLRKQRGYWRDCFIAGKADAVLRPKLAILATHLEGPGLRDTYATDR